MQNATLNCRADGDRFVRVDVTSRLAAEELLDHLLYFRHAALAANQNHVVDVADLAASVLEGDPAGFDRAFDQLVDQ
ncbi:MAG: NAD-specific glutamate dehydrogenase [Candidatus Accumulibacter phosphatis]|uniref:NAD-specific glutamate dehydrogenase n=1 Tax=Candidatus Accumulibacter phosphatis TaxID=327160 RepID=A0A080M0E1_9PROT|nr:MAG: NAD-specific glutamate dehydrogenase [Candidatus Accumulibacter phosphatis]